MTAMHPQAKSGSGGKADWFHRPSFIVFVAGLMAVLSMGIDICLPALPHISDEFRLEDPNDAQTVISGFILAFGCGHLFQGFLADRFGRKPILIANLGVFAAAGAVCALATSFETLLIARVVQGLAAAGSRVVGTAILRDVKEGDELARSMSLAMMVFTGVPIMAPFVGQGLILLAGYRAIFALLALLPIVILAVAVSQYTETWPRERHLKIRPAVVVSSLRRLATSVDTLGYTAVGGVLYGMLFGYITSAPQVYLTVYDLGVLFPVFISMTAIGISLAAFFNARIVGALGARRVVTIALALVLAATAALWLGVEIAALPIAVYQFLIMVMLFGCGMAFANCSVLAIQPHGPIAGTAAAMVGGTVMVISAVLSHVIGHSFNGTVAPIVSYFAAFSVLALVIERVTALRSVPA